MEALKDLEAVPTLDDIARDPSRAQNLRRSQWTALLLRCTVVQSALAAALCDEPARDEDDQHDGKTLDANALAERLGISRRTLFRTVARFPFIKRTSRRSLAARERDLNRWLARRA